MSYIDDLLEWSDYCGATTTDDDGWYFCTRNEHDEDTPHRSENGHEWPSN